MIMNKNYKKCLPVLCLLFYCFSICLSTVHAQINTKPYVIVGYVTSWSKEIPDPKYLTHINYAFGHVAKDFKSVTISNPDRLHMIARLKKKNPKLKVLLSIGGWGSGNFSEMAATDSNRLAFALDCKRIVDDYNLDGIDIDWEFPTSSMAHISSSPEDKDNYTFMMQTIRKAIGTKKLLTLASIAGAKFIDFAKVEPYIDFVNIMAYDMAAAPQHHSGLYRSSHSSYITADESVKAHLEVGVSAKKLVLGIPFYGHGKDRIPNFIDYNKIVGLKGYQRQWDDTAKAPYLTNAQGDFVCTYEDVQSIGIKCSYIKQQHLLGAMYWDYAGDTPDGILHQAIFDGLYIEK